MKPLVHVVLALALVAAVVVLPGCAGCTQEDDSDTPNGSVTPTDSATPTEPVTPAPETALVRLYFTRGEYLGVAGREVEAEADVESRAEAAMKALLQGPTAEEQEFGLGTVIPAGTTLNDVAIQGSTATVDLNRQFESGGGSLSMLLRVAQVVYTLTQFDGVTQVAFKLDGAVAEAIGGEGVIVSPSVSRADFEDQTPAIFVESPYPGQEVTSPIAASGTANVFEAQFNFELKDPAGAVIAAGPVRATSGTGTRGTFDTEIAYGSVNPGMGTVILFDISEADGSKIEVVEIPVRMK